MKFIDLNLAKPILKSINAEGYVEATPVQAQAIPSVIEGHDVLASAQTGTGKTAAFALPILHRMATAPQSEKHGGQPEQKPSGKRGGRAGKGARCLVLCPTRELATQIGDSFAVYAKHLHLKHVTIFGGVKQNPQVRALSRGVQTIIATPGRLLDLMNQGHVNLSNIETIVLDEADRMLDMGFIHDIKRIATKLPKSRQTLLFSATMPKEIRRLADELLQNPVIINITPKTPAVEAIDQSVYFVTAGQKPALLADLLTNWSITRGLVFTRTKHGADKVVKQLNVQDIQAEAIHGNKTQAARQRALKRFKQGKTHILVATDIASRGIDVDGVSHVINYDLTHEPETYVHRIGRTARAGASGAAVSFCSRDERKHLKAIERLLGNPVAVASDRPDYAKAAEDEPARPGKSKSRGSRRFSGGQTRGKAQGKSYGKSRNRSSGKPGGKKQHHKDRSGNAKHSSSQGAKPSRKKSGSGYAKP